jgi:FkbM family methyltransferase
MDLYEHNVIYKQTANLGCIFIDLEHNIQLLIPFEGFNEYIGLCWDVFVGGLDVEIRRSFVFCDIGANLFNASLLFAQNTLCKKVFSFEIIPDIYEMGSANLKLNPHLQGKIEASAYGLYNESKELEVTYYPLRSGASGISEKLLKEEWLVNTNDSDFAGEKNKKVFRTKVVEAYAALSEIRRKFPEEGLVIKVDAENSEVEIVKNLLPMITEIHCFLIEFHSEEAARTLTHFLKGNGFRLERRAAINVFYNKRKGFKIGV